MPSLLVCWRTARRPLEFRVAGPLELVPRQLTAVVMRLSEDMVHLDRPHGYYQARCHRALPARQPDPDTDRRRANARHHRRLTTPGAIVGLALVLWDERGNPISISNGTITASGWATNAAGTYIASSGYSVDAGYLAIDVSQAAGYNVLVIQISDGIVNLHTKLF